LSLDTAQKTREKIKQYWDERAKQHLGAISSTTDDVHLRELEINTIIQTFREIGILSYGTILDVGCGDGYSTAKLALAFPHVRFHGIDYSATMIEIATKRLHSEPRYRNQIELTVGDVTELAKACGNAKYDIVLSDRCLINLESSESQQNAMSQIAEHTKSGGYYVAIENFVEGQENMNEARKSVGLPEIPIRWHNLYFREGDFTRCAQRFFGNITFKDFSSSYYFATRVIYSAMCQMRGEKPDYNHEIHELAVKLPWFGKFSPIRMAVMRRL